MNGKDLLLGLGNISHKYYEEAENDALSVHNSHSNIRKAILIAAVIALLAVTITACVYVIQRIKINLVQHNIPTQTEIINKSGDQSTETQAVNVLTDCYPQTIPEGYRIVCGEPLNYNSRNIQYYNENGNSITFWISTQSVDEEMALRPPVEESIVTISCGEAILKTNEGAQVLRWENAEEGYYANLFTDDVTVDLVAMAESVDYGEPIPVSVWYHRGQEWNPWYPQTLPEGYTCSDVAPVTAGYQSFEYTNGDNSIRYGISTERDLAPTEISDQGYWEETEVNGTPARLQRNQSTQRALFWENKEEGFYAFLETMDETVDLETLAESVGPGSKMEVSKSWFGPDYTIELEQEPATFIEWQSVYPQNIPDGYALDYVGNRAYGQQTIEWKNSEGDTITYTLYFRLGQYERQFEGIGEPEPVSINGLAGFLTGNSLLWADGKLGFGYDLVATGDVNLVELAESVGPGPELEITNDTTPAALAELGDYQITVLPDNMVEDGISGCPLEDGGGWYSYIRRWYFDKTNNDQVYFTYETYSTDCDTEEEVLKLFVPGMTEPEFASIQGYPGITLQDGESAYVAWIIGDVSKGVSFQMFSEQFTVKELLEMAQSVQKH